MTSNEAQTFAHELNEPIALKLVSDTILHKSDVGGVRLGLASPEEIKRAFTALEGVARDCGVPFRGALAVEMATPGVEVAVGIARSELGGHVVLFAAGGTAIEVLDDVSIRPAPINLNDARELVAETRAGQMLANPRGLAAPPLGTLYDLLVRLSEAVAGSEWIQEIDLNPVRVSERGVAILDARVILT